MIRSRFLFISLIVLTLLVSGCSPQSQELGTPTPTPTRRPTVTSTITPTSTKVVEVDEALLRGLQIRFIHPWATEVQNELAAMVDQFNQTNEWGIHVIMESPGSAGLAAKAIWDEIDEGNVINAVAAPINLFIAVDEKEQLVTDLGLYIFSEKYGLAQDQIDDFNQVFWAEGIFNDKYYGIPAQQTITVMIYNSSWAEELGFNKIPTTPEEFKVQICSANMVQRKDMDVTNDGMGGWIVSNSSSSLLNWLVAFNAEIKNQKGFNFNTVEVNDAFTYLFGLYKENCAWSGNSPQPYTYFARRQALVYTGQLQDVIPQSLALQREGSEDKWEIIPFPGIGGQSVLASGFSYGVLESDPERDLAAWLFIRWLSEPEQQARLLRASGTFPLGREVMTLVGDYTSEHPQWEKAVTTITELVTSPKDADWIVVSPVLEDAGWQLFNSQTKSDDIKKIINEMDLLTVELSERYP